MGTTGSKPARRPSLLDLSPDVLGSISKFLDGRSGGVKSLITVIGTENARSVRSTFLKDNLSYLGWAAARMANSDDRLVDSLEHTKQSLLKWMEVNDGWRNALKPFGEQIIQGVHTDIVLNAITGDGDEARVRNIIHRSGSADMVALRRFSEDLFSGLCGDVQDYGRYPIVVGVDGQDVTTLPYAEVRELILEWGKEKALRLVCFDFSYFFHDAAFAIDLGLRSVLQCLLEDVRFDVNAQIFEGARTTWRTMYAPSRPCFGASQQSPFQLSTVLCRYRLKSFGGLGATNDSSTFAQIRRIYLLLRRWGASCYR